MYKESCIYLSIYVLGSICIINMLKINYQTGVREVKLTTTRKPFVRCSSCLWATCIHIQQSLMVTAIYGCHHYS